eukprot:scaffold283_cov316-Pavlova_lutheri.AAC.39
MPSSQRMHDSKDALELQQGNTNHAPFRATCTRVDEWQRERLDPLCGTVKIVRTHEHQLDHILVRP